MLKKDKEKKCFSGVKVILVYNKLLIYLSSFYAFFSQLFMQSSNNCGDLCRQEVDRTIKQNTTQN